MPLSERGKILRHLGWLLLALLLAAAALLIARKGDMWLQQISEYQWDYSWWALILSSVLLLASLWLIPEGWTIVCRSLGSRDHRKLLRGVWFASQLGRYIPGKIWLFAGRAGFLRSRGMGMARATAAPVVELVYTAAAAGLSSLAGLVLWEGGMSGKLYVLLLAASALALVLPFVKPLQKLLLRMRRQPSDAATPLDIGMAGSLRLLGFYAGLWLVRSVALLLWLRGFGFEGIGLGACLAGVPLSWLAGYAAFFVPGGIGVREAALVGILSTGGPAGPLLLAVGGQRLLLSLGELALGLLSFGTFRKAKSDNDREGRQ